MTRVQPFDLSRFERTSEEEYSRAELDHKLQQERPLRIKYGIDVTAPFLHIGHAVNLWMMRDLQDHGHKVVFLIGDFTTRIGDPTDKDETRGKIPHHEITQNAELFIEQASRILRTDSDIFEIRRNSEWYDKMRSGELLDLLTLVTHSRLIERDMFARRSATGGEIYMHELLYPVLQGYDSYALESDLTIVGTDQLFNELMGRLYQDKLGQEPQVVMTTKITPGIDGREKQSKSLGNYIAISDSPREKYGKAMRLPDNLTREFMEVYTTVPLAEIDDLFAAVDRDDINPMAAKRKFASALVERYHGQEVAAAEESWFTRIFSAREEPTEMPQVTVLPGQTLMEVLVECMPQETRSGLRRLVSGGAVRLDGDKLTDVDSSLPVAAGEEHTLRVGRRRWFKLVCQKLE